MKQVRLVSCNALNHDSIRFGFVPCLRSPQHFMLLVHPSLFDEETLSYRMCQHTGCFPGARLQNIWGTAVTASPDTMEKSDIGIFEICSDEEGSSSVECTVSHGKDAFTPADRLEFRQHHHY
jgi:hypothetical protein